MARVTLSAIAPGTAKVGDLIILAWYDKATKILECSALAKVIDKQPTGAEDLPYRYTIGSVETYSTKPHKRLKIKNESGAFVDILPKDYLADDF